VSYRLLFEPYDNRQEIFNLIYHLKLQPSEVKALTVMERRDLWERTIKQYEFEKRETKA
jgi:hypothetical protein